MLLGKAVGQRFLFVLEMPIKKPNEKELKGSIKKSSNDFHREIQREEQYVISF